MTSEITNPGRWKPGQSGNPNGRPRRKRALMDILLRIGSRSFKISMMQINQGFKLYTDDWFIDSKAEVQYFAI
jgi:hypothetical protein